MVTDEQGRRCPMIKFYKIFIPGFVLCISSLVNLWGDLSTGLINWYPFDGNASDMSGGGNHATVHGADLGTDRHGQPNKAYVFDGVDDYMLLSKILVLILKREFTFSIWFKGSKGYIFHDSSNHVENDFDIGFDRFFEIESKAYQSKR